MSREKKRIVNILISKIIQNENPGYILGEKNYKSIFLKDKIKKYR